MTTAKTVGAVSSEAAEWYAINWQTIHQNVRRLQVRIVQATKAGRWNKVKSLQRLLTHSYSGKVLAVRRVTENTGKKTPGVDQIIWKTPEDVCHSSGHSGQRFWAVGKPETNRTNSHSLFSSCEHPHCRNVASRQLSRYRQTGAFPSQPVSFFSIRTAASAGSR